MLSYISFDFKIGFLYPKTSNLRCSKWLRNYLRPFINYFSNLTSRIEPVDYLFYESNWHCTSLSTFYRCYLNDNILTLKYLSSFFICLIVSYFLYKEKYLLSNNLLKYILLIFSFSYIFWSFIGWYPPIRFSYYSLGHLIIILFMYYTITYKHQPGKFLILSSYLLFAITLNHWNSPKLIEFNFLIYTSILLFLAFLIYDKNSKSYS